MKRSRLVPLFLLAATVAAAPGCASGTGGAQAGAGADADGSSRVRTRADVISQEEMAEHMSLSLYEIVQRLRPQWLSGRGPRDVGGGGAELYVYQDNVQMGTIETLRQMRPGPNVVRVRFLDASTAGATLPGLTGRRVRGAILIETRR
jgi:hypothetical protein